MARSKAEKRDKLEAAATWKLEDAKARFSEVVRRAHAEGPQAVTVRGRRAVVILDVADYERLAEPKPGISLVDFLEGLDMGGLDLTRELDTAGRPWQDDPAKFAL
jgi:prevent-host-death family protein